MCCTQCSYSYFDEARHRVCGHGRVSSGPMGCSGRVQGDRGGPGYCLPLCTHPERQGWVRAGVRVGIRIRAGGASGTGVGVKVKVRLL